MKYLVHVAAKPLVKYDNLWPTDLTCVTRPYKNQDSLARFSIVLSHSFQRYDPLDFWDNRMITLLQVV